MGLHVAAHDEIAAGRNNGFAVTQRRDQQGAVVSGAYRFEVGYVQQHMGRKCEARLRLVNR